MKDTTAYKINAITWAIVALLCVVLIGLSYCGCSPAHVGMEQQPPVQPCPAGWTPYQGTCYRAMWESVSYAGASTSCEAMGAELAICDGEAADLCVTLAGGRDAWIGCLECEGLAEGLCPTMSELGRDEQSCYPTPSTSTYPRAYICAINAQ